RIFRTQRHGGRIIHRDHVGIDAHVLEQPGDDLLGFLLLLGVHPVMLDAFGRRRAPAGRTITRRRAAAQPILVPTLVATHVASGTGNTTASAPAIAVGSLPLCRTLTRNGLGCLALRG